MNNPLPVQPMPSTSRSKRWLRKLLPALSMLALVLLLVVLAGRWRQSTNKNMVKT